MGPNLYITPPASFTQFHQDGFGTVDSGHLCLSGANEVVMLRRLSQRHKGHGLNLLKGVHKNLRYDGLYDLPHGDGLVSSCLQGRDEYLEMSVPFSADSFANMFRFHLCCCEIRARNRTGPIQMLLRLAKK